MRLSEGRDLCLTFADRRPLLPRLRATFWQAKPAASAARETHIVAKSGEVSALR
jgi:hypothetical protein